MFNMVIGVLATICVVFFVGVNGDSCTSVPGAFCIDMSTATRCPGGYTWSWTGCGDRGLCCMPTSSISHLPRTTEAPSPRQTYGPPPPCGRPVINPHAKIVGGKETTIETHPWMISLQVFGGHHCGGSLIGDRWVLTAGHCVDDNPMKLYPRDMDILVGSTDSTHFSKSLLIPVEKVYLHPQYNTTMLRQDIALIKLAKPVDLNSHTTKAVCLPKTEDNFDGKTCFVTGWGDLSENAEGPDRMHQAAIPVIDKATCRSHFFYMHEEYICAGDFTGAKDSCTGDSGGPLVCPTGDGSWTQAGVVSKGSSVGCGRKGELGYYTEVAQFKRWIDQTMRTN